MEPLVAVKEIEKDTGYFDYVLENYESLCCLIHKDYDDYSREGLKVLNGEYRLAWVSNYANKISGELFANAMSQAFSLAQQRIQKLQQSKN